MYFVYILTNKTNKVLYTGVTNNLYRRLYEHKNHLVDGFSSKYNTTKLIYYEVGESAEAAIAREKQIKAYRRDKKIALINELNSERKDLSLEW
ncbi:GIY-YIG nuclease family protein [Anaerococcus prevotii]|uniref:GIY-YIG catalytic domain protein n=1 Tax=Anaerococcus prevotii ACS-065-V-Col13 TaxID=879305 RepID=F0GTJ4_9FIRM|nr:GIY-YIG nuclease family protein [Anaerococcus prevotii]EGC82865.1 GIY-YIG catalytic domain protein [Anaerococcus prevotii ACS-065-V-Col13]MDU5150036.1 GIY-YIG nuclease family protein [Anaerococcus prevotii]